MIYCEECDQWFDDEEDYKLHHSIANEEDLKNGLIQTEVEVHERKE